MNISFQNSISIQPVLDKLGECIRAFPSVQEVILYGSRAKGTNCPFSDVDIAVVGVKDNDEWLRIRQLADVEDDRVPTLLKIDIVRFERVNALMQRDIRAEGKILMDKPVEAFARFTKALADLERKMMLPGDNKDCRDLAVFAFMFAQETAWKAFKGVLKDKTTIDVGGPGPVLHEAFSQGWLGIDDQLWFEMAKDRNLVAHTYEEEQGPEVYLRVKRYAIALRQAHDLLIKKYPDLQG